MPAHRSHRSAAESKERHRHHRHESGRRRRHSHRKRSHRDMSHEERHERSHEERHKRSHEEKHERSHEERREHRHNRASSHRSPYRNRPRHERSPPPHFLFFPPPQGSSTSPPREDSLRNAATAAEKKKREVADQRHNMLRVLVDGPIAATGAAFRVVLYGVDLTVCHGHMGSILEQLIGRRPVSVFRPADALRRGVMAGNSGEAKDSGPDTVPLGLHDVNGAGGVVVLVMQQRADALAAVAAMNGMSVNGRLVTAVLGGE